MHLVGDDHVGPADRESLRQDALQRGGVRLIDQNVLGALLRAEGKEALAVRPGAGAAAGAEVDRHLIHAAVFKAEHLKSPFPAEPR